MKTIAAKRLADGRKVYLAPGWAWTTELVRANAMSEAEADGALDFALRDILSVAGPYVVEIALETGALRPTPAARPYERQAIGVSAPRARHPDPIRLKQSA